MELNQSAIEPQVMTAEYLENLAGYMRSYGVPPYPCGRLVIICQRAQAPIAVLDKTIRAPRPKPPMAGRYLGATDDFYFWDAKNA
jgi:hypothetical protein